MLEVMHVEDALIVTVDPQDYESFFQKRREFEVTTAGVDYLLVSKLISNSMHRIFYVVLIE